MTRVVSLLGAFCALLYPLLARSQTPTQSIQDEARADVIVARAASVQAGYGVSIPAGIYVRMGVVAALGAGARGLEGRADLVSRFSLDPFRQSRWAPYGGAGISGRFRPDQAGGSRGYLLVLLGVEGPLAAGKRTGWVPAVELGLGGGARVGFVLRRAVADRR
jgi:hypothetical protein